MSGVNEFVIPVDKGQLIRQRFYRQIESLFNVRLEFTSDWNTAKRTGNEWIKISGNEQERQKAEEYTKGISNPETKVYFLIPEHLQSRNSWNRDEVIWQIQRESSALISSESLDKLYIQGSEISVATAISLLEEQVNYASHSQNRLFAPNHQNEIYFPQQVIPPSNPYASNNYGPDIIVAKGAAMVNHQQQRPVIARGASPYNEDHLTEFASKLGYSIEEINTAKSKCTSVVNENSLLQQLMTLFPRKFPHDAPVATNSKVTRDSSQNFEQKIDVSTEEKNIPLPKDNKQNKKESSSESKLRHIVVDGSNVAMSHGNREVFSCKGIMICVNYFKQRGHTEITVFVPHWRKEASKPDRPIVDQQILLDLEKERILAFTPSRRVNGRRVICYDDRYVVKFAAENDGIIVSNDNFRDLEKENPEWKKVIEEKLLMYTFVKDCFMPPDDPLGRHGPKLDEFLKKGTVVQPRLCPYRKKCTYGQKCKFYHPERMEKTAVAVNKNSQAETVKCKNDGNKRPQDIEGQDSVLLLNSGFTTNKATEVNAIQQQAKRINTGQQNWQSQQYQNDFQNDIQNMPQRSDLSSSSILQQQTRSYGQVLKQQESLQRSTSPATSNPKFAEIMRNLQSMFPNKIDLIRTIMNQNPGETDVSRLVDLILRADIN